MRLNKFRATASFRSKKFNRVVEVVCINLFINVTFLCVPLLLPCVDTPAEADADNEIVLSSWGCAATDGTSYNHLSTLFFGGEESIMKQMLGSTATFITWPISQLLLFLIMRSSSSFLPPPLPSSSFLFSPFHG